jgi:quercetin dioxygenase-like cupin family protein
MKDKVIFIKNGDDIKKTEEPGKLFRMMVKSSKMEAIISELEPFAESKWYKHDGEELHLVLEGKMQYSVEDKVYNLNKGDLLWHQSTLKHKAKSIYENKTIYITIGTPPTFM